MQNFQSLNDSTKYQNFGQIKRIPTMFTWNQLCLKINTFANAKFEEFDFFDKIAKFSRQICVQNYRHFRIIVIYWQMQDLLSLKDSTKFSNFKKYEKFRTNFYMEINFI